MKLDPSYLNHLMSKALEEASKALDENEVPVGAVIAHADEIIAAEHNQVESNQVVSAHAECLAIQEASKKLRNWRLSECILCVTLEPCPMCMGAIRLARIPIVVFGARDEQMGAAGSLYDLAAEAGGPRVIGGIKEKECRELLRDFFSVKREG